MGKITFVTRFLPSENKVYTYIRGRSRQIRQNLYDCPGELLKSEALQMVTNACEFLTNPCEFLTKLTIT